MKIRGQRVRISLYQKPVCHLETPDWLNSCMGELLIEKIHRSPKVLVKIINFQLRLNEYQALVSIIRGLKSILISRIIMETNQLELQLDSGHPFLDDFLYELGRQLEVRKFNPDFGEPMIIEDDGTKEGTPIGEAINRSIRTRKWAVAYGDEHGYSPSAIVPFSFTEGLYMSREQAMKKISVVAINEEDLLSDIGGHILVRFADQKTQKRAEASIRAVTGDVCLNRAMVLVEITD